MAFSGELIDPACSLGKDRISVNLGRVYEQYLYKNQRTPGTLFELSLNNCNITQINKVKIKFDGTRNSALTEYLVVTGSTVRGVAIGLETPAGQALPLGSSAEYSLQPGDNVIKLNAYIRGEPNALINKAIRPGAFSALATFTLEYF
ncbi:fimbrial protein [Serratia aquatilis]|uniref:Fimbrial protein n=2 Tax=Serratia aquatilis TaxID=1737515 RepID=A0ABV6EJ16_9GAMM